MSNIKTKTEGNLLIVEIDGDLHSAEAIKVINQYYRNGIIQNAIWDFSHGSLLNTSDVELRAIANAAKKCADEGYRQGGKTVFVGNAAVEYGLLRMYTAIAETSGVSVEYNVFKTTEEAKTWIQTSTWQGHQEFKIHP